MGLIDCLNVFYRDNSWIFRVGTFKKIKAASDCYIVNACDYEYIAFSYRVKDDERHYCGIRINEEELENLLSGTASFNSTIVEQQKNGTYQDNFIVFNPESIERWTKIKQVTNKIKKGELDENTCTLIDTEKEQELIEKYVKPKTKDNNKSAKKR